MNKYARSFLIWLGVALIVAVIAICSTSSPSYRKCQCDNSDNKAESYQPSTEEMSFSCIRERAWMIIRSVGLFIDENNGSLTALATIAIAGFTLTLWRATIEQGKLTNSAISLARDEFIATHRAKIVIRNMHLMFPLPSDPEADLDEFEVGIVFYCMNVGETDATITKITTGIVLKNQSRLIPRDRNLSERQPDKYVVSPPKFAVVQFREVIPKGNLRYINRGDTQICCVGCVEYKDGRGAFRQTGFVRIYNPNTDRFDTAEDSEYEYSY